MKILLVTSFYPEHGGGLDRAAGLLAAELAARGAQIEWIAAEGVPDRQLVPTIERRPVWVWNGLEDKLGIPYPIWGPSGIRAVLRAARRASVVHVHDCLYFGSVMAFFAAKIARKPFVVTQHIDLINYSHWLPRLAMRVATNVLGWLVLGNATRVVIYSEKAYVYFKRFVRFREEPARIQNGFEPAIFHPVSAAERAQLRRRLGLPEDRRLVLFIGRYVEKKGLHHIRALAEDCPDATFVTIGWGPLAAPATWDLPNVIDCGRKDATEIAAYYQAADALLLPSIGEGFPLVLQEALGCGLPAIVGEESGAGDPRAAPLLLASPLTREHLKRTMRAWLDAPPQTDEDREKVAARARDLWSWDRCGADYLELFERALIA